MRCTRCAARMRSMNGSAKSPRTSSSDQSCRMALAAASKPTSPLTTLMTLSFIVPRLGAAHDHAREAQTLSTTGEAASRHLLNTCAERSARSEQVHEQRHADPRRAEDRDEHAGRGAVLEDA